MPEAPTTLSYQGNAAASDLTVNGSSVVLPGTGQSVTMAGFDLTGNQAECQLGRGPAPGLYPPAAPVPTNATSGGTVAVGTYGVIVTYVNAAGETVGSPAGFTTTTTGASTLTVPSPAAQTGATGWNAYVTQANGSVYTKQNASPTAIGTGLTLTAPPTSNLANPPAANSTGGGSLQAGTSEAGFTDTTYSLTAAQLATGSLMGA